MGFPGYFLIVADFINWAKNNGVPVGPGRGSGAGSLVAYALGITDLDPLRYNLLFERFLNPERVSMPDFDIDFCQHGRDRVIQYVKEKYGADAVSQIATFGTMAAKAAVRDVGRVLDLGYMFTDGVAKLIPFKPGKHVTIADAMKEEPQLQERYDNEDEVQQLLDLAQRVEGLTRNVGMHAGGVLIAPGKLTDFCPLYTQGDDAGVVSQYDKDDVEAVGLVKFDFLGLTTLTILDWAERYIRRLDPTKADWSLARCRSTTGVVRAPQEGQHGRGVPAGKPRHAGHAEGRAARPLRRHHRARGAVPSGPDGPDPELLRPQARAREGRLSGSARRTRPERDLRHHGLSGAGDADGADHRRLLARRRRLAAPRDGQEEARGDGQAPRDLREGAAKNGLTREKADEIFDLMEKFAGYGFNKSHAAAYALLAYHTAWLKAHHPAEFMAANMTLAMDDTDKVKILFDDCVTNNLVVLPPDINQSHYRFEPVAQADGTRSRTIRYGLGAVKGSGQNAIEEILRAREEKPFADLFDFCERVDRRIVNRRTVEALIRAGAFDSLNPNRAQMLASVPLAMEAAEQAAANAMQAGLFDMGAESPHAHALVDEPAWDDKRRLQEEKGALGFYLSGHLFDAYRDEVRRFVRQKVGDLKEGRDKLVAGIIARCARR
jgi:DNA polymerase-3 subunit alpha